MITSEEILKINNMWKETDKNIIMDNLEKSLWIKYPEYNGTYRATARKLAEIADVKLNTAMAWMNRSIKNSKIPLIKLCQLSILLNVSIQDLLKE